MRRARPTVRTPHLLPCPCHDQVQYISIPVFRYSGTLSLRYSIISSFWSLFHHSVMLVFWYSGPSPRADSAPPPPTLKRPCLSYQHSGIPVFCVILSFLYAVILAFRHSVILVFRCSVIPFSRYSGVPFVLSCAAGPSPRADSAPPPLTLPRPDTIRLLFLGLRSALLDLLHTPFPHPATARFSISAFRHPGIPRHSLISSFLYSGVPPFRHAGIPLFCRSVFPLFWYSIISSCEAGPSPRADSAPPPPTLKRPCLSYQHSNILLFRYSGTLSFRHSVIPLF